MKYDDVNNAPKCAGIYCIKNTINGKCYIGQAIKLQKRLKAHWKAMKNERYSHIVLYKAIKKYGIENFELIILYKINDALSWRTKSNLDFLEKKYIQEYDSYNNGYNSTLGGMLGYKHTEETKKHLSELSTKVQEKIREELVKDETNWIKCKNNKTDEVLIYKTVREASLNLEVPEYIIRKCLNKTQKLGYKVWQFVHYFEDFEQLPKYNSWEWDDLIKNQFKTLSNKEEICTYIRANPRCTFGEIQQTFTLSRKTFYNYRKELGILPEQRTNIKVLKEDFLKYLKDHTKDECIQHFGISERLFYKYRKKYLEQ